MKAIGLFSGVGGIELGFKQSGIETIYSLEVDKYAVKTFSLNHDGRIVNADINNVKSDEIPDADIIHAGFPCQAFSIAGYRKGFEDERGNVFFQLARIIRDKRPAIIFIENVKNLVGHDDGNTYRVIKETLENYGYYLKAKVLNAKDYGNVPQNRERIYIVGFQNIKHYEKFDFPKKIKLKKSIKDILLKSSEIGQKYFYDSRFKHFELIEKEITDPGSIYQWRRVYVRKNKSFVCPTLTANMGMGGHNVPLILTDRGIRKLTPREAFLFQGFPKNFKLPDLADSHLYKQAGNSVVVPVIKRIVNQISKSLIE